MTLAAPPAWSPCSPGLPGPRAPHPCGFPGPAQGFACPGKEETKTLCCLPSTPAAPSAPSSVKFSELTTTSVNVSWEAPQFPNGVLEGYRLVYEPCTPVDGEWGPQHGSLNTPCRGSLRRAPLHRHWHVASVVWPVSPSLQMGNGSRTCGGDGFQGETTGWGQS